MYQNPHHQPPPPPYPEHQPPPQEPNHEQQDFQQLLDALMVLPGRQHLPILSQHDIPDRETICVLSQIIRETPFDLAAKRDDQKWEEKRELWKLFFVFTVRDARSCSCSS
ncbi:hypothetical protein ISN44_As10g009070 [Arabidopsis suecica]|uniref:Uncharacterized protein n=1 Tax=Arabidopsis suecica TaxID=45249 RepID=A0A8T1ZTS4_ARASU|nr:hypothetical protein ISN44_As10g009070 [Arabidopsis suecica]